MTKLLPAVIAALMLTTFVQAAITEIKVFPPDVELSTKLDHQSLVVLALRDDGVTEDVTSQAKFAFANPAIAKLDSNTLVPAADGETTLKVTYADKSVDVPVKVRAATVDRPISFKLDVMPVFTRAGCNSGSCHGSARGQDGFNLSLFGYDPDGDHYRLTREIPGRRINLSIPEESLLIEKAIESVPHSGGGKIKKDDQLYGTLMRWLRAGVPQDPKDVATPVSLEIYPKQIVLEGEQTTQRMTVRAKYSDGTDRDVTSLSLYMTSNVTSADISEAGVVTAKQRGEAFVLARFATFTVGAQVIVIPKNLKYQWPNVPEHNYVDTLIHNKLKKLRMLPSDVCSDEVFMRRAYLDIAGVMPTEEEYNKFMTYPDGPGKREKLINELLNRKEFAEIWVMKWAELLQIRTVNNRVDYKAMLLYFTWLQERIQNNEPMDKVVRDLLGSRGGTFKNPATNYYQSEQDTLKVAENVAQVFMGMRIQCAQCHNHPFDRWTMDDYYGFAAFFSQIARKRAEDPRETIVYNRGSGDVRNPVGNRVMEPKFLGGDVADVKGKDRREVMAGWLTSTDNPYFARNLVNIVWAHFFGQGIVEPVDDVRVSNPPSNPELLDELARRFIESNYDLKQLVRDVTMSRTYQLSTRINDTNALDTRNFTRGPIRRMRAEVLLDVIGQVTDTKMKFRGLPLGARAVQIADGNTSNYFLTTFGRATRETVCSCEVQMDPNLSQALHLLNGDTVHNKVMAGGIVRKMIAEKKPVDQIVESLYIRTLARKPTEHERTKLAEKLAKDTTPAVQQKVLEDLFWALLNTKEFMFNH